MAGKIQNAVQATGRSDSGVQAAAKKSVGALLNSMLDGEGYRRRFDKLLGERSEQFVSSIITLANADKNLQQAILESPVTVIQAALKAATYDLPIDPAMGYAYIVPFRNKKDDGSKRMEATFILGYRGLEQLAIRSAAYSRIPDATDVREGELVKYDRLTGDAEFNWIEDEDERESRPIVGYAGYFRLLNGAEKTIYMTKKQIESHEKKFRKGQYMGKGWRDDWDAMARKTVLRRLIMRYGLMSIEYRGADKGVVAFAESAMKGQLDGEDQTPEAIEATFEVEGDDLADPETGELPDFLQEGAADEEDEEEEGRA